MKIIAVVGLGYVGLPLAVEFGKKFKTIGFDLVERKVESYQRGIDPAGEITRGEFTTAVKLEFTCNPAHLAPADFIIVAVPTPVDSAQQPDFSPLIAACKSVGQDNEERRGHHL